MIEEAALPYKYISSCLVDKIILVAQNYSDEDMIRLYQGCDVYLSIERANGWDLPSVEAMACGKPSIGYYVGGSTEYRDESVCLCLPVMNERIAIPTAGYHPLYTGQAWPVVNETELVDAMVKLKDAELRDALGKAAKARISRWFDIKIVAENIRSLVSTYDATDYRSNYPAQITIGGSSTWRTSSINPQAVDDLVASLLCHPSKGLLATRRFVRSLPQEDFTDLFKEAKPGSVSQALLETLSIPWKRCLRKIKALNVARELSKRRMRVLENEVSQGLLGIYATDHSAPAKVTDNDIEARKRVSVVYPLIQTFASDRRALRSWYSRYQGKRCFIIGNGPSLNDLDLSKLAKEYTFGMNKIFLLYDRIDWRPSFYTLLDWRIGPSVASCTAELADSVKFLPYRFRGYFPKDSSTYWFTTRPVLDGIDDQFSPDIAKGIPSKGTILMTAIQIAFFIGFRDIYLIGTDTSYTIPDNVLQSGPDRFKTGTKLYLESTEDDDPNHFDPSYFGKGAKWHDPNVDEMIRQYKNMRKGIEYHGGRIYNATHGGKLEVFERVEYDSLFAS